MNQVYNTEDSNPPQFDYGYDYDEGDSDGDTCTHVAQEVGSFYIPKTFTKRINVFFHKCNNP